MNYFDVSIKILYERIIYAMLGVCVALFVFYLWTENYNLCIPNLTFIILSICSLYLSKTGREHIAYHLTLIIALLVNVILFFLFHSQFYSIILMGSSMTIYTLVFIPKLKYQRIYLFFIMVVEFLLFHQAMDQQGIQLTSLFWPEYFTGIFHIGIVYIIGYYFINNLKLAHTELDQISVSLEKKNKNITAQKEELQKYVESNSKLENFAFLASHELKSPLRSIKSFIDLIRIKKDTLSPDQVSDYLDIVSSNSEKMSLLIDALQDLGSVAQKQLDIEEVEVRPLIESIVAERILDDVTAEVSLQLNTDYLWGDIGLLTRLFSNLLGNAIKFRHKGIPPKVKIECEEHRGKFVFRISDNGIGISSEKRQEVFELFNRQNTYQEYQGMGIGLALSKKIVDMHNGTISIKDSTLGGVTFEVRLPIRIRD